MNTTTLTKCEIAKQAAATCGMPATRAKHVIDCCLALVLQALANGQRVEFRDFGIWTVRVCKEKAGINPRHPKDEPVRIPAHRLVRFRAGKSLKDAVKPLTP